MVRKASHITSGKPRQAQMGQLAAYVACSGGGRMQPEGVKGRRGGKLNHKNPAPEAARVGLRQGKGHDRAPEVADVPLEPKRPRSFRTPL